MTSFCFVNSIKGEVINGVKNQVTPLTPVRGGINGVVIIKYLLLVFYRFNCIFNCWSKPHIMALLLH